MTDKHLHILLRISALKEDVGIDNIIENIIKSKIEKTSNINENIIDSDSSDND